MSTHDDALAELRASEARLRTLLAHAVDATIVLDETRKITDVRVPPEGVLARRAEDLSRMTSLEDLVARDDRSRVRDAVDAVVSMPGAHTTLSFRVAGEPETPRRAVAGITNLLHDPSVEGIVVSVREGTELDDVDDASSHHGALDPLTGLPGRARLLERLTRTLASRRSGAGTTVVLLLDLDRFKVVNDSLGHHQGDRLLVEVARRLVRVARPADVVARIGGDEFVVVCHEVQPGEADRLARRILHAIEQAVDLGDGHVTVSTSMGVVTAEDTHTTETILRDADSAMYVAKERGGNRFAIFDETVRASAVGRFDTEKALRRAVEHDELELHYQPIVEIRTRDLIGVEALLRWNHPQRGRIEAAKFVPAAEASGLITMIGTRVLERACKDTAERTARGASNPTRTWVNIGAQQLIDPALLGTVRRVLDETGLDPRHLGLEITETGMIREPEAAYAALISLRELGIAFALDDFGTGYSSLSYLHRFPVDVVKIDQSFVKDLDLEPRGSAIVRAVIAMSHALGMTVIAEGVERTDQLELLDSLGCDAAQGFLLGAPVPLGAIDALGVS